MKYIAFLRGINVGGNKMVKMEELRKVFEKLGYTNVKTLINSGNIIFETEVSNEKKLNNTIEDRLEKTFGWRIAVMIRSSNELRNILQKNPFSKKDLDTTSRCYISFLSEEPDKELAKAFLALQSNDEVFTIKGKEVYASLKTMGDVKVFNKLEKVLQVFATNRNINTLERIFTL